MKFSKNYILFFLLIASMFFGALSPSLTVIAMVLSAIISLLIGFSRETNYSISIGIILLLCFQNFAIGTGAHLANNSSDTLKYITQIPFISSTIIFISLVLRRPKIENDKHFILLLLALLFSLVLGHGSINAILMNVRNMTVFYVAYRIGYTTINSQAEKLKFYAAINTISFLMLIVGIILLIGNYSLYSILGINEVYIAKGDEITGNALNGRFYTDIGQSILLRMGSLYYEPVNLSYFFAAIVILSIFFNEVPQKVKIKNVLVSATGLLLCLGKGGIIVAIATIIIIKSANFYKKISKNKNMRRKIKQVTVLILAATAVICILYYQKVGGTVKPHFWGVMQTWTNCIKTPFGHGLGTGGNMSTLFGNNADNWLSTGGESGFMSFLYQLGFQGMLIFCICFIKTGTIKKEWGKENDMQKACMILPLILLTVSVLQENTFTPQCIVPFMLIIGGYNRTISKYSYDKN